ncbi:unnamed protein product [Protopolystoma xenopodis]|uniref:Phosphatidylserine decarboxylase n=1 Tax=Protopolystoma xenopodis TaxID=117903 RepID=A0A448X5V0_9PLAT|nr:unnamed protein product [Protopolystoma xenopodis]
MTTGLTFNLLSFLLLGRLLTVRLSTVDRLPGLFTLNERVAYLGEWDHGFFSMTAVGAFAVGSIRVGLDPNLRTNVSGAPPGSFSSTSLVGFEPTYNELVLMQPGSFQPEKHLTPGQKFGEFRLGSTVVLLFEAPRGQFKWAVREGDRVKMGQALLE